MERLDKRSGYDAEEIATRRRRQAVMDRNNTEEGEAIGRDSVDMVINTLSYKELFPWLENVYEETDRTGDDDWVRKTDVYADVDYKAMRRWGFPDQFRISVKSSRREMEEALNNNNCKKVIHLEAKEWRQLWLILLVGQNTREAIVASFLMQAANHVGIWSNRQLWVKFVSEQTEETRKIIARFEAQCLDEDWERLLYWVKGWRVKRDEGLLVHFL